MRPERGIKKFKQDPKYPHLRSEGLTTRHNGGTRALERRDMTQRLIIGSTAIRHHFPDFPRDPKDYDVWCPRTERFAAMRRNPMTRQDFYWDDRLAPWVGEGLRYATPDELYTMKVSHSSWDIRNGSWDKHMHDVVWLQERGAKLIPEFWETLTDIWKDLHGRPRVNLNQESGAFFTDAVVRIYDHDSIHDTVAHYDRPLWMEVLKDGESVAMDMDKVWTLPFPHQIDLFREEVYATALERYLIPAWESGEQFSPTQAYFWALKKTITSLTKGKSSRFMIENYFIFRELPREPLGTPWYIMRHMTNRDRLVKL